MKHIISALLYFIVLLIYINVREHELMFMWLAWVVGHCKELFDTKQD